MNMKFCELLAIIACAFPFQRFSINRLFLDTGGCVIGNYARQHQWENDLIIECDLEDHDDSHDGGMGGGCEKCAHADKCERAGIDLQVAKDVLCATAEQKSKAGTNESVGVKTPPTAPELNVAVVARILKIRMTASACHTH